MVLIDSSTFIANILVLKNSKILFFKQNNAFQQKQFLTVCVASIRFYLDLWTSMSCKTESDFYSLVGFHCEYLRTQKLGNLVFHIKQPSRQTFQNWVCSVFKFAYFNRHGKCVR